LTKPAAATNDHHVSFIFFNQLPKTLTKPAATTNDHDVSLIFYQPTTNNLRPNPPPRPMTITFFYFLSTNYQ